MPEKHPVIALVGPSGSGKTTLMLNVIHELPDMVFPITNVTNRPKRDKTDDLFYRFEPAEKIREMAARGELAQYLEYAGNTYGSLKSLNDEVVAKGFGIQAFTEQGVLDLRAAGYEVVPVKVTTDNETYRGDAKRATEDRERSKMQLDYRYVLHNSFEAGGLQRATRELIDFILSLKS